MSQLLRAVRNTAEHVHQWGPEVEEVVGLDGLEIMEYFSRKFPWFLLGVWEWACGERECLENPSLGGRLDRAFGS